MPRTLLATLALCLTVGIGSPHAQPNVAADHVGFGRTMAASAEHVFVGSPRDVNTPGRVYVYNRNDAGAWQEQTFLTAEDGTVQDGFGATLDASGDTLVVGAPQANTVYVFNRTNNGWTQTARLTPTDSTSGFGTSLARVDDRLFVGSETTVTATEADTSRTGAVHLFRHTNGSWNETEVLRSNEGTADDGFARTLTASANQLLVGAPDRDGGAVVAFRRGANSWTETQTLTAAALGSDAQFGTALEWAGEELLVGAPRALNATGAVQTYTYNAADTMWTSSGRLLPSTPAERPFFGMALASAGPNLWVGAPGPVRMTFLYQNRATKAWPWGRAPTNDGGALYRFTRSGGSWSKAERIAHSGTEGGDGLGATLAANETVVAAGLPGDDFGAGTMALYAAPDDAWTSDTPIAPTQGTLFSALTGDERPCSNGHVDAFSCKDVDLKAFLPTHSIGGRRGIHITDIWGWTDPKTDTEYAVIGRTDGVAFVDVSNPSNPVYVGELPQTEAAHVNTWGDVKVYDNHAFAVSDNAGDHGMQVFDLTRLRDAATGERPKTFDADALYDKVNSVHNIFVNDETGYAYLVGSSGGGTTCGGGLHMVNVQDPLNPTFAGCFNDSSTGLSNPGATHDVQCVAYQGPDADYKGREICVGSNETAISIADVTNKDSVQAIATGSYPDHAYVHQGWFGEEQRYFYQNDELDELQGKVDGTRTLVWDLKDLDNPTLVNQIILDQPATDHNLYVRGSLMYEANYTAGLRILDVSDPVNPKEVAHFDTKPHGPDAPGFAGAWSTYPFFESGIIVVSSIDEGLFVLETSKKEL